LSKDRDWLKRKTSHTLIVAFILICTFLIVLYLKPVNKVDNIMLLRKESGSSYFTNENNDAVYLSGSDNSLKDIGPEYPPKPRDFEGKLNMIEENNHNFMRLWTWELTKYKYINFPDPRYVEPFPWQRTGEGMALDGRPKFDLTQFNQTFFDRLRSRVILAGDKGIYV